MPQVMARRRNLPMGRAGSSTAEGCLPHRVIVGGVIQGHRSVVILVVDRCGRLRPDLILRQHAGVLERPGSRSTKHVAADHGRCNRPAARSLTSCPPASPQPPELALDTCGEEVAPEQVVESCGACGDIGSGTVSVWGLPRTALTKVLQGTPP